MKADGWIYYNRAALPTVSPKDEPDTAPVRSGEIWKTDGHPLLARWTTEFDCGCETEWWYVVKDTPFDIGSLKAKRRYEINISSPTLNRPIEETCATLLHEMCHLACAVGYGSKILDADGNPDPYRPTAITAWITKKPLSQLPRPPGWQLSTTPKNVGQLTSPELTCWISLRRRAGRTCRWLRVFPFWMCSERSPRAGAEQKSLAAPANISAPNVAIAAEQRRQST